jgi:hypothetical protein
MMGKKLRNMLLIFYCEFCSSIFALSLSLSLWPFLFSFFLSKKTKKLKMLSKPPPIKQGAIHRMWRTNRLLALYKVIALKRLLLSTFNDLLIPTHEVLPF